MTPEEELDQRALLTRLDTISKDLAALTGSLPYSGSNGYQRTPLFPNTESIEARLRRVAHNMRTIGAAYDADAPHRQQIAADQARYRSIRGALRDLLKD